MAETSPVEPPIMSASFNLDSPGSLHAAVAVARTLPFVRDLSLEDRVLISTVVSELGSNILKFAGKGSMMLSRVRDQGHDAIQVVARDQGPGIADLDRAMEDGFSTAGTLGLGLPAVRRIMTTLKVDTACGKGTKVVAVKWLDSGAPASRDKGSAVAPIRSANAVLRLDSASLVRPHPNERLSGDIAVMRHLDDGLLFGVIDVSGHGAEAAELAARLGRWVHDSPSADLEELLQALHQMCAGTRGAAVGLAVLNTVTHRMQFAGIGNVHVRVMGARTWRGVSRDGVVGERMRSVLSQWVALSPGDVVMVASDGVSESARSAALAGALVRGSRKSAADIAQIVIQEAGKASDDASCVVVRCL